MSFFRRWQQFQDEWSDIPVYYKSYTAYNKNKYQRQHRAKSKSWPQDVAQNKFRIEYRNDQRKDEKYVKNIIQKEVKAGSKWDANSQTHQNT